MTSRAKGFNPHQGYTYSRVATPNRSVLEQTMAKLEGGTAGFALSSGMAAIQLALSILKPGDQLIWVSVNWY
ncbi:PLP-dependent transferase [Limosilactobacillus fastidiosus]|uniref:PLP-dependent transferase n=1 Tax=Limosilactobacillus fastidiosus TaxID=2759855 RepID=UPI001E5F020A|nr:PLP-dependent transferase [Limosilactobacillus fastidiosus]MCD7086483.1 PLP-dependent transferase [Limosilactobacillus fastidiosus]MCD7114647.1 PLP-dependent transferase [Limosilactobacillus fastidiosus]MCD7116508.1 PLP-dependent transferase [Limosilactobacillus fastidiosus]